MEDNQKLIRFMSVALISLTMLWVFSFSMDFYALADNSGIELNIEDASNISPQILMVPDQVQELNPAPPAAPVKLVFIHHSVGDNWLEAGDGDLGDTLGANNYYVSETFYDWGPDNIGSTTDIGDWWTWFRGTNSSTYLSALYASDYQHASYSRPMADPGGENEVIMFKSCYPNSYLDGEPDDPPTAGENLLRGQPASSEYHTVANAKGIYNDILEYFETRQDKLFIVITAPPIRYTGYGATRGFNNWLVYDWLDNYPYNNVAVFDFFNIMTTNGGDYDTNDFGLSTGNHHRLITTTTPMTIEHIYDGDDDANPHLLEYPSDGGSDSHPTSAGNQKATGEFIPLLNVYYNCWKYGQCVGATTGGITLAGSNPDQSVQLGETAVYALSVTANDGFSEPVTLTLQDAPAGTSHSFIPNYESPPSASDLIISTTTSTPLGTHLMTVIADGVTVQDTLSLTMTVNPTVTLSAAPLIRSVKPGQSTHFNLTVATSDSFSGLVSLTEVGSPPGVIVNATPNPVDSHGSSQLSIYVQKNTVVGTYPITVTADAGAVQAVAYITLVVEPEMHLSVLPAALDVIQGETALYTLILNASQGYNESVTFSLLNPPTASVGFTPNPIVSPGESQLSITTTLSTNPGIYSMVAVAESAELISTTAVDLVVMSQQPSSYALSVSPALQTIPPGKEITYTVAVTNTGASPEPVTLSALGLPEGVETNWSVNPVAPGNETILTCTVPVQQPQGEYPFIIAGVNGGAPVVVDATLIIDYPFKICLPLVMKTGSSSFFFQQ